MKNLLFAVWKNSSRPKIGQFEYLTWDSPEIEIFYVDKAGRGKAKKKTLKVDMRGHDDDFAALDRHFVDVILGKEKPAMPLKLAAKHLDIIFRIYKAASPVLR